MAYDRFISYKNARPSFNDVVLVVRNFFSGVGEIDVKEPWIGVRLPGRNQHWLSGVTGAPLEVDRIFDNRRERTIEVVYDLTSKSKRADVLTREGDAFTNGLADALAECLTTWWEAKRGL